MSVSLLLLAVFLFLFLKKTYREEVAALQKETGYLFVNTVRGVEGKMFEKILLNPVGETVNYNRKYEHEEIRWVKDTAEHEEADTSIFIAFLKDKRSAVSKDSSFEITIRASESTKDINEIKGSLSVMMEMDGKSIGADSALLKKELGGILSRLEKGFSENMKMADLPVQYKVVRIDNDSSGELNVRVNGSYTDLISGEKYGVEISGFNRYVLRKMVPQILFSLGLFSIVSLAFFTVFKNLQEQQRLTALKNDFIQNITHELKTPIATMGVAIEALQGFGAIRDPERTREYLDISKNELSRLSLLVDKVLRTSLFEENEPVLNEKTVDIKSLTDDIAGSMKIQFEKLNAKVTTAYTGSSFLMQGDPLHLSSVIYNLLDNALKYSGENPKIHIVLENDGQEISLRIKDQGVGIAPVYQDKIFDKFFRVPKGAVHDVKGHGLGLSYVASVVRKHGGTITVRSAVGKGSEFIIRLPVGDASL